jgi:hypothetical protein
MKDYVFIIRYKPLTPEVFASVRPKWALIIPKWKEHGHFVDSFLMTNTGHLVSGNERIETTGPVIDNGHIVLSIIRMKAESMEQAIELSKQCATLDIGGAVEVREVQPAPVVVNPIE